MGMHGYRHPLYLANMLPLYNAHLVIIMHSVAMYIIIPTLALCGCLDSCSLGHVAMALTSLLVISFVIAMRNQDERDICRVIIEWEILSLATIIIIMCGMYAWIPFTFGIMMSVPGPP